MSLIAPILLLAPEKVGWRLLVLNWSEIQHLGLSGKSSFMVWEMMVKSTCLRVKELEVC